MTDPLPELRRPVAIAMLRPWIDVGRVGTLSLNIIQRHLGAREIGRLAEPGKFFDFTRYRPRMRIVDGERVFTTPNTIIHCARDESVDRDYLFLHIREPHAYGEDYCRAIFAALSHFGVREYCRVGGMYDSVPHTRPLLVTGSMSDEQAAKAAGLVSQRQSTYQGPTSIVNMVAELVTAHDIPTSSLMAHLPQYMQLDEDHMGCGIRQYEDVNKAVESNPEVRTLIGRLESYYDRVLADASLSEMEDDEDDSPNLAPGVEQFLREVTGETDEENSDD